MEASKDISLLIEIKDLSLVVGKFVMDVELWDIRNRDITLELFWLTENGFPVDTQGRCQRNVSTTKVFSNCAR